MEVCTEPEEHGLAACEPRVVEEGGPAVEHAEDEPRVGPLVFGDRGALLSRVRVEERGERALEVDEDHVTRREACLRIGRGGVAHDAI